MAKKIIVEYTARRNASLYSFYDLMIKALAGAKLNKESFKLFAKVLLALRPFAMCLEVAEAYFFAE